MFWPWDLFDTKCKVIGIIFAPLECLGGISPLPGCLSWRHLTGPLPVRVALCSLLKHLPSSWKEGRRRRQKGEEEKRPQRAPETCVGVRSVLQGHASGHQGTKPQRHVRRSFKDSGVYVGQPGGGAKTGERNKEAVMCLLGGMIEWIIKAFFVTIQVYKRKNEAAKKDYLKALAEYRSGQSSQVSSAQF